MSDNIKDGGPAFPVVRMPLDPDTILNRPGMSLRDWFAGQALAVMTTAPDYSKGPCDHAIADRAYVIADAMLKAREGAK